MTTDSGRHPHAVSGDAEDTPTDHGGAHHDRVQHDQHEHEHAAAGAGHGPHGDGHSDHVGMFRRLFWAMLVIALPVVGSATCSR